MHWIVSLMIKGVHAANNMLENKKNAVHHDKD